MRYTIFSIDGTREHYTDQIKTYLSLSDWDTAETWCVNGSDPAELARAQSVHGYAVNFPDAKLGHLGIWYTVLNALTMAPIITFEDDALLHEFFLPEFERRAEAIPGDFDFFSLFLPRDSDHMFYEQNSDERGPVVRSYQRYGGVSMYYSEQGAQKIEALLERDGITGQYDDTLYAYAKAGELNGYTSHPGLDDLVYITGYEPSLVQDTLEYKG